VINHSKVLYVLYIALIEIRATENIKKARVFADIVHNVPKMIMAGSTEEEVAAKVMLNAKRQGLEEYFSKLFETAKNK
jgi:transcriptional regulator